ncbi:MULTISPECIES: threonine/serine dehydratase [unclassified Mesobacillus]|uniref:threonine ammonia-lyase n=1 Tax=unclassified Mesobacillus TaxID=2675270 RepID=UPI002040784A|nr:MULTISPECIES: threonine/serine dehydratase [unclassified Mesobacillus]MCM3124508.1 threonine/serine dehydratase [Mesobacillus sp. MER 33]MCM3234782.1 threonine/serine dehydratase [Mesobacillus sp. MER 48]
MISLKDVKEARERISDIVHVTPILKSDQLSMACGNQIFFKSEHLQKTGSFKIRGASNKVKQAVENGAKYVTAASSGNHGQAVSYVANKYGVPATIVVPEDISQCKMNAIQTYNGKIEMCGTTSAERLPRAKEIADQENGVFIPPYDDPYIMAGQGTVGLEVLEQIQDVDAVIVPIGGGGLLSGILTAIKETNPKIKVIGVEPEIANDTYLSLKNKEITAIPATSTIADGLRSSQPGDLTFPVLMKYLDDLVLVSEEEIRHAFSFVLERMKQLIEPSSATTVAAAMHNKLPFKDKKVVTVISGGNVDLGKISGLIS